MTHWHWALNCSEVTCPLFPISVSLHMADDLWTLCWWWLDHTSVFVCDQNHANVCKDGRLQLIYIQNKQTNVILTNVILSSTCCCVNLNVRSRIYTSWRLGHESHLKVTGWAVVVAGRGGWFCEVYYWCKHVL